MKVGTPEWFEQMIKDANVYYTTIHNLKEEDITPDDYDIYIISEYKKATGCDVDTAWGALNDEKDRWERETGKYWP